MFYKSMLRYSLGKAKVLIEKSCIAFIVPDPYGVLEEGQIHIKSSVQLPGPHEWKTNEIVGPVLVTRHPCKVPSDVQKVMAVSHPLLRDYPDQIVFSVKGSRSLASMLGGGDYDGDTAIAIWDPRITEHFTNADPKFASPPDGIFKDFLSSSELVSSFLDRHRKSDDNTMQLDVQKQILAPLDNTSSVGQYSNMHLSAVYSHGYDSPEAHRLAYMFNGTLDGLKIGKIPKPEVFTQDVRQFLRSMPAWTEAFEKDKSDDNSTFGSNTILTRRQGKVKNVPFIMDSIVQHGNELEDQALVHYESLFRDVKINLDETLVAPWWDAEASAKKNGNTQRLDELKLIAQHVQGIYESHRALMRNLATSSRKISNSERDNKLKELARIFDSSPDPFDLKTISSLELPVLRASYAYLYDWEENRRRKGWTSFPWDVGMRELCALKAGKNSVTITTEFYERMRPIAI